MKIYGLIGYPLSHSFSQKYFTDKFISEGLDGCSFELFPLADIGALPFLIRSRPQICGLAVTIPYKQTVLPYLNHLDKSAQVTGAVNCIKIRDNELTGYNTDITGFSVSFIPNLKDYHTHALILGSGGASKAVQFVLKEKGIPFLIVTRRNQGIAGQITYGELDKGIMDKHRIIINCTPLGMSPDIESAPAIPYHYLSDTHYLFDMVYNPGQTQFLKKGAQKGAVIKNGLEMLRIQAEENWKIWNEE